MNAPPRSLDWRRECAALAVLTASWMAFWWQVLSGEHLLYVRDLVFYALPAKQLIAERLAVGELAEWTSRVGGGLPFLADASNQTLYPFNALLTMMSPARAISMFVVLHSFIGLAGGYALARTLGIGAAAAVFAALVYGFSGYVLSISDNVNYQVGAAWMPGALAVLLIAVRDGSRRAAIAAAAAVGMMLLAGDALDAAITLAVAAILALHRSRGPGRVLAMLAAIAVAAVALAAVQALPTALLFGHSARSEGIALVEALQFSLPPARLLELAQPAIIGAKYPGLEFLLPNLYPVRGTPWAASIYVGALPIALACLAVWRRPRDTWPWAVVSIAALILALGRHTPLYELAHQHLPFVASQRYPEKLVLVTTLGIAQLSGHGLGVLIDARRDGPVSLRTCLAVLLGALAVLFVGLLNLPMHWLDEGAAVRQHSAFWSSALGGELSHGQGLAMHGYIVAVALAAVMALHRWRPAPAIGIGAALVIADLAWMNAPAAPRASAASLALDDPPLVLERFPALRGARIFNDPAPRSPSRPALRARLEQAFEDEAAAIAGGVKVLEVVDRARQQLSRNDASRFGVDYLNGLYSPLQPRGAEFLERLLLAQSPGRFLAMSSADYVVTAENAARWTEAGFETVHEDPATGVIVLRAVWSQPFAHVVGRWVAFPGPVTTARDVIVAVPDFRRTAIIDRPAGAPPTMSDSGARAGLVLEIERPRPERIAIRAEIDTPLAHLVVNESWAPGWSATVDGVPTPVLLANFRSLAVGLTEGHHLVELRYETPGLIPGAAISSLAVLCGIALWTSAKPRRAALVRREER